MKNFWWFNVFLASILIVSFFMVFIIVFEFYECVKIEDFLGQKHEINQLN